MPEFDSVRTWEGRTTVDRDGDRIGTIHAIYLDDQPSQPEWALLNTGLFGTKQTSPLAHGPHGTAKLAATAPSNQPRPIRP
jgi:hypothetical protein